MNIEKSSEILKNKLQAGGPTGLGREGAWPERAPGDLGGYREGQELFVILGKN